MRALLGGERMRASRQDFPRPRNQAPIQSMAHDLRALEASASEASAIGRVKALRDDPCP